MNQKIQLCEIEIIKQLDTSKNFVELYVSKSEFLVDTKLITQQVEINYETRIILLIKELMKVRNNEQLNSIAWNAMTQKLQQRAKEMENKNKK